MATEVRRTLDTGTPSVSALAATDASSAGSSRTVRRGWPRLIYRASRTLFSAVVATRDPPARLDALVARTDIADAAGACGLLWPAVRPALRLRLAPRGYRPGAAPRSCSVSVDSGMARASVVDPGRTGSEDCRTGSTATTTSTPPSVPPMSLGPIGCLTPPPVGSILLPAAGAGMTHYLCDESRVPARVSRHFS